MLPAVPQLLTVPLPVPPVLENSTGHQFAPSDERYAANPAGMVKVVPPLGSNTEPVVVNVHCALGQEYSACHPTKNCPAVPAWGNVTATEEPDVNTNGWLPQSPLFTV